MVRIPMKMDIVIHITEIMSKAMLGSMKRDIINKIAGM